MNPLILCALLLPAPAAPPPAPDAAPPALLGDECVSCGKRIWLGERCLTCITAEARAARSHPCTGCEQPILLGDRCAACLYAAARAHLAHPCADCGLEVLFGARCGTCSAVHLEHSLRGVYARGADLAPGVRARIADLLPGGGDPDPAPEERALAEAEEAEARAGALQRFRATAVEYAERTGTAVGAKLVEVDARRRAEQVVGAAVQVAQTVEGKKRDLAYRGLDAVGRMPVHSELGWTSLEDLARFKIVEVAPSMAGTDLAHDPAAVLTALIVADHLYFLVDLKLVETPDGPVSIVEALADKSGQDAEGVLACVTVLESVRRIQRGEDLTRAVRDLSRSLELLNPRLSVDGQSEGEAPGGG